MKEFIIPVNNEAHSRALKAIVGDDTAQLVLKAYQAIDSAMVFGYERGLSDAAAASNKQATEAATDISSEREAQDKFLYSTARAAGFDAGYEAAEDNWRNSDHGMQVQDTQLQGSYDDGYVDGVKDAREDPEEADDYIGFLTDADGFDMTEGNDDFFADYENEQDFDDFWDAVDEDNNYVN